jgi:thiamine biosynthesis lipoprotein
MGMTVVVEIADPKASKADINSVYDYFHYVDEKFSTYKETSEISKINKGLLAENKFSQDMSTVIKLCAETKLLTGGYFDIKRSDGILDPSGLVKGWAIYNAAEIIKKRGFNNYYVDAGGDVQVSGVNTESQPWKIGIQDPFSKELKIVKIISTGDYGVATSGTYIRGQHIYNPHDKKTKITDIVSLTVIGPNIYEADRFATAAFAMGKQGIRFIENLNGFEGYMIDSVGIATMTSNFEQHTYA